MINSSHIAMDSRGLKDMAGLIMELYRQAPDDPGFIISRKPVVPRISRYYPRSCHVPMAPAG